MVGLWLYVNLHISVALEEVGTLSFTVFSVASLTRRCSTAHHELSLLIFASLSAFVCPQELLHCRFSIESLHLCFLLINYTIFNKTFYIQTIKANLSTWFLNSQVLTLRCHILTQVLRQANGNLIHSLRICLALSLNSRLIK